jgi:hypothetical protein
MLAESLFCLHGINREQSRYDYLVSALTKEAVSLGLGVVEHPPERHLYTALKQSLLDSHQVTIAALHKMEPLNLAASWGLRLASSQLENAPILYVLYG